MRVRLLPLALLLYVLTNCRSTGDKPDSSLDSPDVGVSEAGCSPSAEVCDGQDNDCNGVIDDDAADATTWYLDDDGDGYGPSSEAAVQCVAPTGYVEDGGDCDDADPNIAPDQPEMCDGADNDCDEEVDEPDAVDATTWFVDADGDGHGDPAAAYVACGPTSGDVSEGDDCDDDDPDTYPEAGERCDGVDNDCDGIVDEDVLTTWYPDDDGDHDGDPDSPLESCDPPTGYVSTATDCNDGNASIFTGAPELCDGLDNDCDAEVDEDSAYYSTWYLDADGDDYGDILDGVEACSATDGRVLDGTDCDDDDPDVHPGADERCNEVDDDCDDTIDEDVRSVWYADADGDGFGTESASLTDCDPDEGYVGHAGDCDDTDPDVHPGADETCDGLDQDCDDVIDEDAIDASTWYADEDGDGFGDPARSTASCEWPAGSVANAEDCDDTDSEVHPGSTEMCDDVDNDCDGVVDEDDAVDATTWYADADGDGYGDASTTRVACDAPESYTATKGDCDDTDAATSPAGIEVCGGGDEDCDSLLDEEDASLDTSTRETVYIDGDGDGFGSPDISATLCASADGYAPVASDCDDADALTYPDAAELCDLADNDCDGDADEGLDSCVDGITLPDDPSDVAPELDLTVAGPFVDSVDFLYTGDDAIQTGVEDGAIDPVRVAVLRGAVLDADAAGLPAVQVTILGHEEYGQTYTRIDGSYDIAVEGGGPLTVKYARDGYLPAQRTIVVPVQDFRELDDLVLLSLDEESTTVDMTGGTSLQVAAGSMSTDDDGTRQAVAMFPEGVTATMTLEDGTVVDLDTITFRATEYTVGDLGDEAMPADLPSSSAYTYAVELSADEAIEAGASSVDFSDPVAIYVDNFLGFSAGTVVPVGYYDVASGVWVPTDSGVVLEVLGVDGDGRAEVDIDGTGIAADSATLEDVGVSDDELFELGARYTAGSSLWRAAITHLTPYDMNWGWFLDDDAADPTLPDLRAEEPTDHPTCIRGSTIACESQTLGEDIPIVGTDWVLHYQSDRTPGYTAANIVEFPVTGSSVPSSLKSITVRIEVAGKKTSETLLPTADQTYTFEWDGIDAYGRQVQGVREATISLGYTYAISYSRTSRFIRGGAASTGVGGRKHITRWTSSTAKIGHHISSSLGFGGWSLNQQHSYDSTAHAVSRGDGVRESSSTLGSMITTLAGEDNGEECSSHVPADGSLATDVGISSVSDIEVAPDGTVYLAHGYVVQRMDASGRLYTVAGKEGGTGSTGDGGPAVDAEIGTPYAIAVDKQGRLYIASYSKCNVRMVDAEGVIHTIAGTGTCTYAGERTEELDALSAPLYKPLGLAVDPYGTLYIAESYQVWRYDPSGYIVPFAGTGTTSSSTYADGDRAEELSIGHVGEVATDALGNVYVSHAGKQRSKLGSPDYSDKLISKITPDGRAFCIVGGGDLSNGDAVGHNGTDLATYSTGSSLATSSNGELFFPYWLSNYRYYWTKYNPLVWRLSDDGILHQYAGNFTTGAKVNNDLPTAGAVGGVLGIAVDAFGSTLIGDDCSVRSIVSSFPGFEDTSYVTAAASGLEFYSFASNGRHLTTTNAVTGDLSATVTYDANDLLLSIEDYYGNVTELDRESDGTPLRIVAPSGQVTTLSLDSNGWLSEVTDPDGNVTTLKTDAMGLLQSFTAPDGATTEMTWDDVGRLASETDPAGNMRTFVRDGTSSEWSTTLTTARGTTSTFTVEEDASGASVRTKSDGAGLTTTRTLATDGTETHEYPDGTEVVQVRSADPRFGLQAPILASSVVTLPSGLSLESSFDRDVELSDESDLASLTSQTDTWVVNGKTYTSAWTTATGETTVTSPEGRVTSTVVDGAGNVTTAEVAGLEPLEVSYNDAGKPDGLAWGSDRIWSYTYGSDGFVESATNPVGETDAFTRDADGLITGHEFADGESESFGYDEASRLSTFTNAAGEVHSFTYDSTGRLAAYSPPALDGAASDTTYTYDGNHNLRTVTRPGGAEVRYAYDDADRLTLVSDDDGATTWTWNDGTGALDQVATDGGETTTFDWDGSLLLGEAWTGSVSGSVAYSWSEDFAVESISVEGGEVADYEYDDDGLLIQAGDLGVERDVDNGDATGTTLGGVSTEQAYDEYGQTRTWAASYDGAPIWSVALDRDELGRVTTRTETIDDETVEWVYEYDTRGRLASVTVDGSETTFDYDAVGNRISTSDDAGDAVATYDAQDRLESFSEATFTYTDAGELATKVTEEGTTVYGRSARGALTEVVLPDGTEVSYVEDGRGRRIARSVDGVLDQGFLYAGPLRPVAELDGDGDVVSTFIYGTNLRVPDYMIRDGRTWRILSDAMGSPRLVIDVDSGEIGQRLDYDVWGGITLDSNPGFQPFGFAGGLYDPDTGLTRLGFRDYDASIGRWISKDPLGVRLPESNLYVYADDDPVNRVDALGTSSSEVDIAVSSIQLLTAARGVMFDAMAVSVVAPEVEAILFTAEVGIVEIPLFVAGVVVDTHCGIPMQSSIVSRGRSALVGLWFAEKSNVAGLLYTGVDLAWTLSSPIRQDLAERASAAFTRRTDDWFYRQDNLTRLILSH